MKHDQHGRPRRAGLTEHRTATEITADDGAKLWTVSGGRGPHLALAHGGPGFWDYLDPLASKLESFATVHRWDQRGSGRSHHGGPYSIERFLLDMESVREHFGASRWVAGGHSWGATLALLYGLRYPGRTLGVLYVAGTGLEWAQWRSAHGTEVKRRLGPDAWSRLQSTNDPMEANRLRWSCDYVSFEVARPHVERMLAAGFEVNLDCNNALNVEIDSTGHALFAGLEDLMIPVLIVQGAADPRPLAACDSLAARLPMVERAVLPDAGHFPWVEQPDRFRTTISAWFRRLKASRRTAHARGLHA